VSDRAWIVNALLDLDAAEGEVDAAARAATPGRDSRRARRTRPRRLVAELRDLRPSWPARDPLVADHIRPRILGGTDDLDSLAPTHRSCNGRKGSTLSGIWIGDGSR
jgi:hypothetical protein